MNNKPSCCLDFVVGQPSLLIVLFIDANETDSSVGWTLPLPVYSTESP